VNPLVPDDELAEQARAIADSYVARIMAEHNARMDRVFGLLVLVLLVPVITVTAGLAFVEHVYWFGAVFAVLGVLLAGCGIAMASAKPEESQ
jgi:hypothetical protein